MMVDHHPDVVLLIISFLWLNYFFVCPQNFHSDCGKITLHE